MDMKQKFKYLFSEVFDSNGDVKLCGRKKCKELIHVSKALSTVYGNEETGMMHVDAIKALGEELFPGGDDDIENDF